VYFRAALPFGHGAVAGDQWQSIKASIERGMQSMDTRTRADVQNFRLAGLGLDGSTQVQQTSDIARHTSRLFAIAEAMDKVLPSGSFNEHQTPTKDG
jgi:hypothetical protein